MKRARRLAQVPDYPFARWGKACREAAERGLDLIRLDAGSPDLPPPERVVEALCDAARRPSSHGYSGYRGTEALRNGIAAYYERRFGVSVDPDREVLPLIGSKGGIVELQLATLDPGDAVLAPNPGYAPYSAGAHLADATIVPFALDAARGYLPDFDAIPSRDAQRASVLWLNYPNNPTGATATNSDLASAVAFAREHDLLLCHDAPYTDVWYEGDPPPSVLQVPGAMDVAVEFNSLSKTFNMAGWRLGTVVGRNDVIETLARIVSNIDSGILTPIQEAAATALETDAVWIAERNAVYRDRLRILHESLVSIGLSTEVPRATLYLWAQLPLGIAAEALARRLLNETGISIAPGTFFGPAGEGYVRLSATQPTERIQEVAERLAVLPRDWVQAS